MLEKRSSISLIYRYNIRDIFVQELVNFELMYSIFKSVCASIV